jgi:hypothetical protein
VSLKCAHFLEHTDALGSFPDLRVLEALQKVSEAPGWTRENAVTFLHASAPKIARYREPVSGLEITPAQLL